MVTRCPSNNEPLDVVVGSAEWKPKEQERKRPVAVVESSLLSLLTVIESVAGRVMPLWCVQGDGGMSMKWKSKECVEFSTAKKHADDLSLEVEEKMLAFLWRSLSEVGFYSSGSLPVDC